jgi:hypothetical protein
MVEAFESKRHGTCARPPVDHDYGLDNAVTRFGDDGAPQRERGAHGWRSGGRTRAHGNLDALGEVTIHVVGNPAGNLIQIAGTGDNLED